jgi:hypothetical protein
VISEFGILEQVERLALNASMRSSRLQPPADTPWPFAARSLT